jgi:hypothetical protein
LDAIFSPEPETLADQQRERDRERIRGVLTIRAHRCLSAPIVLACSAFGGLAVKLGDELFGATSFTRRQK